MATQSTHSDAQALSNHVVNSIAEIDRLTERNKKQTFKLLDERGAIGFLDVFGVDMGREAQRTAELAIDRLAAKQRAEVIDMARSNLEALQTHTKSAQGAAL